MKKICYLATVPDVLYSFMKTHVEVASKTMEVILISNSNRAELLLNIPARHIKLDIQRKISIFSDFMALIRLVSIFNKLKLDIVHTIMPKTGLIGMFAGWLVGIPFRVHTFTGQVWVNQYGIKRYLLKSFDRLIVIFATHIIVDSPSQREFLVLEGVVSKNKAIVIGKGSICGVDHERFKPNPELKKAVRTELKIESDELLILYLGRLNQDKGIIDLANAFNEIVSQGHNVVLALVGSEDNLSYNQVLDVCLNSKEKLRRVNFTAHPENYMAAADIFCLPSYREGFGQVILEAASSGVPSIASRIYGITDAVEEGKTGLLFSAGDILQLKEGLVKLILEPELRMQLGQEARKRSIYDFSSEKISEALCAIYNKGSQ